MSLPIPNLPEPPPSDEEEDQVLQILDDYMKNGKLNGASDSLILRMILAAARTGAYSSRKNRFQLQRLWYAFGLVTFLMLAAQAYAIQEHNHIWESLNALKESIAYLVQIH